MADDSPNGADSRRRRQHLTEVTRQDIRDYLLNEGIDWSGRLDEPDFLSRLWDLSNTPSFDSRFQDARGDIWQHRVNNPEDWDDAWVFEDDRFLKGSSDEVFVSFLCEMLHPIVRSSATETRRLLGDLNQLLQKDGWELVQVGQISSRPVFEARKTSGTNRPTEALDLEKYTRLRNRGVLQQYLKRLDRDINSDPAAAIGASKELAESLMKTILDDYGVEYQGDDLPKLYRKVKLELRLQASAVPGDRPGSEAAAKTMQALTTTINSIAEFRNQVGSGHGRSAPSPAVTRHARLAFNAVRTVSEFLLDTWHERLEVIESIETAKEFDDAREHIDRLTARGPLSQTEVRKLVKGCIGNFQVHGAHQWTPDKSWQEATRGYRESDAARESG